MNHWTLTATFLAATLVFELPAAHADDDPFEPAGIIPSGPFQGMKVDTSRARTARLLTPDEAAEYAAEDGQVAVANVQHAGSWWVMLLPADGIQDVIFQKEDIPDGLGHGQIRFRFKSGSWPLLVPQARGSPLQPIRLGEFIFTADGTPPIGIDAPRKEAPPKLEQYLILYRLMSLQDNLKIVSGSGKMHSIDQFRLPLSEEDKQRVLKEALRTATGAGMHTMFSLLTRSCVSEALGVIDRTLSYWPVTPVGNKLLRELKHFPPAIPFYLFARGLIRPGVLIPNLRSEFPEYADGPPPGPDLNASLQETPSPGD